MMAFVRIIFAAVMYAGTAFALAPYLDGWAERLFPISLAFICYALACAILPMSEDRS